MQKPANWPQTVIGLTGAIASGKSTVGKTLEELGFPLIEADELAREAMLPHREAWKELVEDFGPSVLHPGGTINRTALLDIILTNSGSRHRLEAIVHPRVFELLDARLSEMAARGQNAVIIEVPLLFEAHWEGLFDFIVTVAAPHEACLKRLMERTGISREKAETWIKLQLPQSEKASRSDYVVINDKGFDHLSKETGILAERLRELSARTS